MWSLETLGRARLSKYFFMREFLYSEIANIHRLPNLPQNPDLALKTGRMLCTELLDPLEETFGRVSVRSGYRSPDVNGFGNANRLNCARNDNPLECHIWDREDMVAGASIVIPWFADHYSDGRDWRDLAWWLHDHLANYSEVWFFPKLCAFNLVWREAPLRRIDSYIAPRGCLLRPGGEPPEPIARRRKRYADFPAFRALTV
ncbi:MAG: hypothetical protein AAF667_12430 [Pseudomonadota bacterium]